MPNSPSSATRRQTYLKVKRGSGVAILVALALLIGWADASAQANPYAPRPDKSTVADSVFFPAAKFALTGGATADTVADENGRPAAAAKFPAMKYPPGDPGGVPALSIQFTVPGHGYYTVSAWGRPERAMWKPWDFIELRATFGGDAYRTKTSAYGTDGSGAYQELCRFYFVAAKPGAVPVRLDMTYATGWIKIEKLEIRHIDRHLSNVLVKTHSAFHAGLPPSSPTALTGKTGHLLVDQTDDEAWNALPSWKSLRADVNGTPTFYCPIHGGTFTIGSTVPWTWDALRRKLICPIGGEEYPNQRYPDPDGMGYFDFGGAAPAARLFPPHAKPPAGARPGIWTSEYIPNFFFTGLLEASTNPVYSVNTLAQYYRSSGDERFAWKAAILLARYGYVYPCLDFSYQGNLGNLWYRPDSIHARPGKYPSAEKEWMIMTGILEAYDMLFDYIRANDKLAAFIGTKVPWIKTPGDVIAMLDRNIVQLSAEVVETVLGETAQYNRPACWMALGDIASRPDWFRRALDEASCGAYGGALSYVPTNAMTRDGDSNASVFHYNIKESLMYFGEQAWALERNGDPALLREFDFWHGEPFAKIRAAMETLPRYAVAGDGRIDAGNSGRSPMGGRIRTHATNLFVTDGVQKLYALGYQHLGTPEFAYRAGQRVPPEAAGPYQPPVLHTRHMPGYGMVILEANPNGNLVERAGVSCAYGPQPLEMSHKDGGANTIYFAKGMVPSPDFGWTPATSMPDRHNIVQIDNWTQLNGAGRLLGLVEGDGVSFADVDAVAMKSATETSSMMRRSLALASVGPGDSYLVDLVRTRGGREQHTYHFHAATGPLELNTPLALLPPEKQTPFDTTGRAAASTVNDVVATWTIDGKSWSDPNAAVMAMLNKNQFHYRVRVVGAPDREVQRFTMAGQADFPNSNLVSVIDRAPPGKSGEKQSAFLAVSEPFVNDPVVRSVVDLHPGTRGADLPRGVAVTCAIPGSGKKQVQVDIHLFSNGQQPAGGKAASSTGGYAFYRELDGAPTSWVLVGNTGFLGASDRQPARLRTSALILDLDPAVYQGSVTSVDWKTGAIVVRGKIPAQAAGRLVTLRTPGGRITSYNVTSARYDGPTGTSHLVLEHFFPTAMGDVTSIDARAGLVRTRHQPRAGNLLNMDGFRYWPYLNGAWVVDEARKEQALLASYGPEPMHEGPWFRLAIPGDLQKLKDAPGKNFGALGEKEHLVFLYDVGAGDTTFFVPSVSVTRTGDGRLQVRGAGKVRLTPNQRKFPLIDLENTPSAELPAPSATRRKTSFR